MRIKVSTTLKWPIERQIPSRWKDEGIEVLINQTTDACDAWVVYQGLHRPESTRVPSNRVFFFGYEPPGLHVYQPRFLKQFSHVITCQNLTHTNVIHRHQAQPWLAGVTRNSTDNVHSGNGYRFNHHQLTIMEPPQKSAALSAICSTKQMVLGHAKRLAFVEELQQRLPETFDLYGYGFHPLDDKWDALARYQYHLVLENSCVPDYWTEKLSDAYLAWCMPIVWGCPNLVDYFPSDAFVMLDQDDLPGSLQKLAKTISSPPTLRQCSAIAEARRRILDEYNLFAEIVQLIDETPATEAQTVRLKDERLFLPGGMLRPFLRTLTDRWRGD